jgi:uncharacterized repeat protein (TIGR01451 family)
MIVAARQTLMKTSRYWLSASAGMFAVIAVLVAMSPSDGYAQEPPPCPPEMPPLPCPDGVWPVAPPEAEPGRAQPPALVDPPTPSVSIRVRVPATSDAGQEVEYRIHVENTSSAAAHHVIVRNAIAANARFVRASPEPAARDPEIQWRLGTLEPGAKQDINLVLTPTDGSEIRNCARVDFEHGQCVRTAISRPTLSVRKEGPTQANLNETLSYKITITNASGPPANGVLLADVLPAGLQHSSGKNRLSWVIGKLAPGESKSVEYQVVAKAVGRWCNQAIASADGGVRQEVETCVTVVNAKLKLTAVGPPKRYLKTPVRYELSVANAGDVELADVRLTASLESALSFVSATDGGQLAGDQVQWTVGTLAPAATRTVEFVASAQAAGRLCSRIAAMAERGLAQRAEVCTDFRGVPAVSLNVEDSDDPIEVGGTTTYHITVQNPGSTTVTNIRLTALVPPQMELVRVGGAADHRKEGAKVQFDPIALQAGGEARFEVEVKAIRPADVRFKVELTADQLTAGPVQQEESTTIYVASPASRLKYRKVGRQAEAGTKSR